jgi:uncharacterized protein YukE
VTAEINLQDDAFDRARQDVVETHDDVRRRRDALSQAARGLLADGWRGVAADQYADAWEEWERGAELVLRGLLDLTAAMNVAHGELSASDTQAGLGAAYLRARLGEA